MYGGSALCDGIAPCDILCSAGGGAACVVRLELSDVFGVALEFDVKSFCIASGDSAHAVVIKNRCSLLQRHTIAGKPAEINVQDVPMLCVFK
jgi:hypothetical protein